MIKKYSWMPDGQETFYNTFETIEECIEEADYQYKHQIDWFDDMDDEELSVSKNIVILEVENFNPQPVLNKVSGFIIDKLQEEMDNFNPSLEYLSEVICKSKDEFNNEIIQVIKPVIDKYIKYNNQTIGDEISGLLYNVETKKFKYMNVEYDELPEKFRKR